MLAMCLAASLTLTACGGGDDDGGQTLSCVHFFASYTNMRSNVRGAMGCWYGMGQDVRYVLP